MRQWGSEAEVGRIKRSADPALISVSTTSKNLCRIGVAALLDAGLPLIGSAVRFGVITHLLPLAKVD